MLDRAAILEKIPHKGQSCLLDECSSWTDDTLTALTRVHLISDNPLRHDGRLGVLVGAEMAMQAAALHGAVTGALNATTIGYLASLRDLEPRCDRLDRAAYGTLTISVRREQKDSAGMVYSFTVCSQLEEPLLTGRGIVMFRAMSPLGALAV